MFDRETKLVIADIGTSKTDIAVFPHQNQVFTYPTLVAYDDQGIHIGDNALARAGAADLVWVKDAARLSRKELEKHPAAFTDFMRLALNRLEVDPPVDLMMSEPALMTKYAREQILSQLSQIPGIQRVYFLPELVGSAFSDPNLKGRFTLVDIGDGNTSVQAFNNHAPIEGAQQTFRAGRTMTYETAEVLRESFDIDLDVSSAGSPNYRYMIELKHRFLSCSHEAEYKIIDERNNVQRIEVGRRIRHEIIECLFDERQYKAVHRAIQDAAFRVKDLASELLSRVFLTGRTFNSQVIMYYFSENVNSLLRESREALDLQEIEIERLPNYSHSVVEGMKVIGKQVQEKSGQWIDLDGFR